MTAAKKNKTAEIFAAPHVLSVLYFIVGVALLALITQPKYMPIHLGLLGIINIVVSYGITRMKKWSLYISVYASFLGLVFGGFSLAATVISFSSDMVDILILLGIIAYIALSAATLIYLALKRDRFR